MKKYYDDKKEMKGMKGQDNFANLPKEAVMKAYPKCNTDQAGYYGDSVEHLDMMAEANAKKLKR